MKKLPLFCSLAALAAALAALILVLLPRPAQSADAAEGYRLEKLNQITDMVLERQVVPADYLRYVDEELAQAVEEYNSATTLLILRYTQTATDVVNTLVYEHMESPGDYQQPELYFDWIGRIAHYALYENTLALCSADPVLGYTLAKEVGGSYGMWPGYFHEEGLADEDLRQQGEDYLTQVDTLLDQLDAARAAS